MYRIDGPGQVTRVIAHEVDRPNGLLVSPRDEFLYVADNNNNAVGGARKLWRFPLRDEGSIDPAGRKLVFDWMDGRGPDGLEMDREGRPLRGGRPEYGAPAARVGEPVQGRGVCPLCRGRDCSVSLAYRLTR